MFDIKDHLVQKEYSFSVGFTPDFHVIFRVAWFFNAIEDVAKNNWLRKFGNEICKLQAFSVKIATQLYCKETSWDILFGLFIKG